MGDIYTTFQQSFERSQDKDVVGSALKYLEGMRKNQFTKYTQEINELGAEYGDLSNLPKNKIKVVQDRLDKIEGNYPSSQQVKDNIALYRKALESRETYLGEQQQVFDATRMPKTISGINARIGELESLGGTRFSDEVKEMTEIQNQINKLRNIQAQHAAEEKAIIDAVEDKTIKQEQADELTESNKDDMNNSFDVIGAINTYKKQGQLSKLVTDYENLSNPTLANYEAFLGNLSNIYDELGTKKLEWTAASLGVIKPEEAPTPKISAIKTMHNADGEIKEYQTINGVAYHMDRKTKVDWDKWNLGKPTTAKRVSKKLDNAQELEVDNILDDKKTIDEFTVDGVSIINNIFGDIEKHIRADNDFTKGDATKLISAYKKYVEIRGVKEIVPTHKAELEKAKNKFQKLLEAANKEIGKTDTKENKTQTKIKEYSVEKLSEFVNNFILKYDDFDKELRGVMYRQLLEQPNLTDEQRKKLKEATEKGKTQTPEEKWKPNVVE